MFKRYFCGSAAFFWFFCADYSYGATYSVQAFADVQYTNNIDQQIAPLTGEVVTESGEISTGGVRLSWANDPGTDLMISANGSYGRRVYSSDSFDPESLKDATLNFLYDPSSSNFRLSIFDSLRQVASDRTSLQTNNNNTDVNVVTAIPSYYINFSKVTRLEMNYGISKVDSEQEETNRNINSATVGVRRLFRGGSSFSVNVSETDVDFVETDQDYEIRAAFFRIDRREGLTRFIIDLGKQEVVDRDNVEEKLISFSLARDINSYGQLTLDYQNGFVGATNVDVNNSVLGISINEFSGFVQGLTVQEEFTFAHSYNRDQMNLGYSLYASDLESSDDGITTRTIDESRKGVTVSGGYQFSILGGANLNAGITLDLSYEEAEFNLTNEENENKTAQLRFSYQRSRDMQLFLQFAAREASNLSAQFGLDERVATIGVSYTPFSKR